MKEPKQIYKFLVRLGAVIITAIFIGNFIHFGSKLVLLGEDAYHYNYRYQNCEYKYGILADENVAPKVSGKNVNEMSKEERKEKYDACIKMEEKNKKMEYKRGVVEDITLIVSFFAVSVFLWWMDK